MLLLYHSIESLSKVVGFIHWPIASDAIFSLIVASVRRLIHGHVLYIARSHEMLPLAATIEGTSPSILGGPAST